jgi:hypothetical protein
MNVWLRVGQPIAPLLQHYREWYDAWEAMGVAALVVGRLSEEDLTQREGLAAALGAAKRRGWDVYVFEPAGLAGRSADLTASVTLDAVRQRAYLARLEETLTRVPEADGFIMDGPEWGYEIDPDHRSYLFADLPPAYEAAIAARGYDYRQLAAGRDRLFERLHGLTPALIAAHGVHRGYSEQGGAGALGGWSLLGNDPDLAAWLRFRTDTATAFFRLVRERTDELSQRWGRPLRVGLGVRLPSLARLCGHDLVALGGALHFLLPKFYIWNRGVDGLYGTIRNWVRTLRAWNPAFSERDAFAVTYEVFGLRLPAPDAPAPPRAPDAIDSQEVTSTATLVASAGQGTAERLLDLDLGFPPAFFARVVAGEARAALATVDDDTARVVPWVDTGLRPHGGDPVTAGDLYRLLTAAAGAGIRQCVYHGQDQMTEPAAAVIGAICGAL